jgi:hypothetical protein
MPSKYEWDFAASIPIANTSMDPILSFVKINPNSTNGTTQDLINYKINSYNDIIYTDLSTIHGCDSSFTIEFTMSEEYSSTDKESNYLTFGHHVRGKSNICITVGRPKDSQFVVIGTISEDQSIKYVPITMSQVGGTISGVKYTYTLVFNHIGIGARKLRLFRKETDAVGGESVLICDSPEDTSGTLVDMIIEQSSSEYSIVDRKLFLGTSMWTASLGWDSHFDVAVMTVYALIFNTQRVIDPTFTPESTEYPTNIIITNLTDTERNTNRIGFDQDDIRIQFNSSLIVNPNNVHLCIQNRRFQSSVAPTTSPTGDLEYTFEFKITSQFPKFKKKMASVIEFSIDFNGTYTEMILPDIVHNIFIKHGKTNEVAYELKFTDLVYNNLLASTYDLNNFIDSIKTAFSLADGTEVEDTVNPNEVRILRIGEITIKIFPGSVIADVKIGVEDTNMANIFIEETTSMQGNFDEILQVYGTMEMSAPTIGEIESDPGMEIDYTIESVTGSTVVLKIQNITNEYFDLMGLEKYKTPSIISRLKVEFIAEDTITGMVITTTPIQTSPNTLHTIEGLAPLETVWKITAVLTDEEDTTTITAIPTANTHMYDGFVDKIQNIETRSPELSNSSVVTNHNSGETFVDISNINSKDIHSQFMTYAGMFDSNQPVTQDIFDMVLVGAVIKFDALEEPTDSWISLGGTFTKVIKKVDSNYDVYDIEYNRDYYVFVFSIDSSLNQNTNTTFLLTPFATVRVNKRYNDHDMGFPVIADLFLRSTFSASIAGDTISGDYVGYDLSGNNSHVYLEVVAGMNPLSASDGSLNVSLIDILYINYFDVFSTKFTFSIDFNAQSWGIPITLLGSDVDAFIQVTENSVSIMTTNQFIATFTTDTTKSVDMWYNLVVMYDLVDFHTYIDGVKLVMSTSSGTYTPQETRFIINKQDVFVNNIQIYTKYDPSIVEKILTSSEKTVELGYDTQGTVVYNLGSGRNPTYVVKPKYSTDAAVNKFAMNFERSDNSSLTIPNDSTYTDMTISSWVKIDSYPETDYPIVSFEDGSLEFGIDSSGYIYFETN